MKESHILQVITIFCCNSSNSSMSQAAGAGNPGQPGGGGGAMGSGDNYSIYSYKQDLAAAMAGGGPAGPVGSDTMRSTAIDSHLGVVGTHTLQSRASPQYRVSDIDPEYARRYHREQAGADTHHY